VRVRGPNSDPKCGQQLVAVVEVRARASGLLLSIRCVHVHVRRRQHPDQPQQQAEAAAAALAMADVRSIWAVVATHGTRTTAATSAQQ
jgi:hypothetical protein